MGRELVVRWFDGDVVRSRWTFRVLALVIAVLAGTGIVAVRPQGHKPVAVGALDPPLTIAAPASSIVIPQEPAPDADAGQGTGSARGRAGGRGGEGPLKGADGRPYGGALVFRSNIPVRSDLVFILTVGSDARPRHDPLRANGDSVHLLAINPRTLEGTALGFPRDSWVEIPGHGRGKLTSALAIGGPKLMAETVRHLTGLPVHYYVVTAFSGFSSIVDALGGVDVFVERRMNDRLSGARFERGWHHFNGAQALAFSRNRHDTPDGDFSRSYHQGQVMLAALAKMRTEVEDEGGLLRWINVLRAHATLDLSPSDLLELGALARRLEPERVRNHVLPGRVGSAGSQSVVYLGADAAKIFEDLRPDAVIGGSTPPPEDTTTSSAPTTVPDDSTSTTDAPAPTTSSVVKRTTTTTTARD